MSLHLPGSFLPGVTHSSFFLHLVHSWGTYRDNRALRLSHLGAFSSHLTVIIGENLLSSFFIRHFFTVNNCFRHDSQKTSMPPIRNQSL